MAFDTSTITDGPNPEPDGGGGTLVWWASSSPSGTLFQLYQDRVLVYGGTARRVTLPTPDGRAVYQVGAVAAGEAGTDFSASLPALRGTGDRALLSWSGGSYLEPTGPGSGLAGFHIYGETTAGGGVDHATVLGTVPAYAPGLETDGYGLGGYGEGGYGLASSRYTWKSDPLTSGSWAFAVVPFDHAGNEGAAVTHAVSISVPPQPPARNAAGLRLTLTYDPATSIATLHWLASPG